MRWVAAGNEFANRGSREFAQELIDHFVLVLHLLVFDENTIFTGNGACGADLSPVREPETGWPPSGVYGLLVPNRAERGFNAETGDANSRAIEPESIVVSQGSRSVEVVRYADSKTLIRNMRSDVRPLPWTISRRTGWRSWEWASMEKGGRTIY